MQTIQRLSRSRRSSAVSATPAEILHGFRTRARSGSSELFLLGEVRSAFDPNSLGIQRWLHVRLLAILYEVLVVPYLSVFHAHESAPHTRRLLAGVYACELLFMVDMYVQLNMGYYEDGNMVRDSRRSRLKYLRSPAFVLDLVALPPPSLFVTTHATPLALLELHKLVRVWRLPELISNLDNLYARSFALLKLAKVLGLTVVLSHFVACGRFAFGTGTHETDPWLQQVNESEGDDSHADGHDSRGPWTKYLSAVFWAFGLLTGLFEGELPQTTAAFAFTILVAFGGFSLFTYLCATFFLLSKCESGESETAEARVNQLKHLLAFHRVPDELQARAVEYLKRYHTQADANDRLAAKLLCPSIAIDIQIELLRDAVARIPVFAGCDLRFMKAVTGLLELVSFPAHHTLFRAGDRGDAMYVVHSGVLHTVINGVKVRELRKGSFFGEVAVFAHLPRSAAMVTTTYCTLYRLSSFHADKLLEGYPRCAKQIADTVNSMLGSSRTPGESSAIHPDGESRAASATASITRSRPKVNLSFPQLVRLKQAVKAIARKGKRRMAIIEPLAQMASIPTPPSSPSAARINSAATSSTTSMNSETSGDAPPPRNDKFASRREEFEHQCRTTSSSKDVRVRSDGREHEQQRSESLVKQLQARRLSLKVYPLSPLSATATTTTPSETVHRPSFILQSIHALAFVRTSFFGTRSRVAPKQGPDAIRGFYDNIQAIAPPPVPQTHWWRRLLLRECFDVSTRGRMAWIAALQLVCCYDWIVVPLELAFVLSDSPRAWVIDALNATADLLLWADVYVNLNLAFSVNAEKIWDTVRSAERYVWSWPFVLDVVIAWPYWIFKPSRFHRHSGGVLRLPRLLRVWRTPGYFAEAQEFFHFNSKQRLLFFGLLLVMLYHIVACLHFSVTFLEGFSEEERAWIPSDDVLLHRINASFYEDHAGNLVAVDSEHFAAVRATQYFRSLYYAANVLAALGLTIEPASDVQYAIAIAFMLSGFVITAIVVDNVQKYFTASAFEQKEFFATRTRIQLFLKRQNAPLTIHQRVNAFLDFWWSAHRGAILDEILQELPETIKRDIVRSICEPAMESLALMYDLHDDKVCLRTQSFAAPPAPKRSDSKTDASERAQLENIVLDNLKFVLYGQHEVIYRPGDYAAGLYFLLEGEVSIVVDGEGPRRVPIGGFFGSGALQALGDNATPAECDDDDDDDEDHGSLSYSEYVSAVSGCIVVFLSREHLNGMVRCFPGLEESLWRLEKQLRHVTVARTVQFRLLRSGHIAFPPPPLRRMRRETALVTPLAQLQHKYAFWTPAMAFDPDAVAIRAWDTFVFLLSAAQCARVMTVICLAIERDKHETESGFTHSDKVTLALELVFFADMLIQSRLGFYEFGNKVMDRDAIRRHYFLSRSFVVDVAALLPLFAINTFLPAGQRVEVLNLNKMLRMFKFTRQFQSLSTRFVKLMVEIRLLKLAFYTFVATHILGCIWFDFAANNSGFHSALHVSASSHETATIDSSESSGSSESSSTLLSFGSNEWLPPEELEHASPLLQYLRSLFWAFGLMSASNTGELPKTVSQSIFSVITMTVGFFLFAYVVGNFSDIIELQDSENRHFVAQVSSLRKLLRHFKLPVGVEDKFKKYFLFKRFHSITQEHVLERVLPPSLLVDIRLFQLQPMIVKVAFLAGMDEAVTRMLVSLFTQVLFVKDEYVCRFGEEGREMFFIFTGVLDIYIPVRSDAVTVAAAAPDTSARVAMDGPSPEVLRKVNEITAGSYFGEAALFTNTPRNAFVKASTSCILYQLSRHSLELVFERYPDWKQKVLRIVKIQQQQQNLARLAQEAQTSTDGDDTPSQSGRRVRSTRRGVSRMDALNTRAEGIEELLLSHRRTSATRTKTWQALMQRRLPLAPIVAKYVLPLTRRLRTLRSLLVCGTDIQSRFYLVWLRLVAVCTVFMAVALPYRLAYDSLQRATFLPVCERMFESLSELVFMWDIWFHFHVRESHESMELYEQDHLQAYKRDRLLVDFAAAFPLDHFVSGFVALATGQSASGSVRRWLRLNRCVKMANFVYYRNEITRWSVAYEANRVVTLWLQYVLVIFWTSCAYFAVAMHEGFGAQWQAWRPPHVLDLSDDPPSELLLLRLLRGFFYATTAFVKKGKTFVPQAELDTAFSIIVSFVGQLVMALMISEIANVYLLYIDNEVQFRKSHITVEHFLARWKVSAELKLRAHAFLTSWWASHAGIDYQLIFNELPQSVRTEGVACIVAKPLSKFVARTFRPLLPRIVDAAAVGFDAVDDAGHRLARAIAQQLHFEGYPRDESVIVEGSMCKAMYFVVRGYLLSRSISNPSLYHGGRFRSGDYFGETGLLGHSVSLYTVTTIRACDLFVLDAQRLEEIVRMHPFFGLVLEVATVAVRQKKTAAEIFVGDMVGDGEGSRKGSDRYTTLVSRMSTGDTQDHKDEEPDENSSSETAYPCVGQLKQLMGVQALELMWRAAFTQFCELILARGSMDKDEEGDQPAVKPGPVRSNKRKRSVEGPAFSQLPRIEK